MIPNGTNIKADSGRRIRVDSLIKGGGQGMAFKATDLDSSETRVLKVFSDKFDKEKTIKRSKFLIDQRLGEACPVFKSPIDLVSRKSWVGHFAPFAPGISLEEFLQNPEINLSQGLILALVLSNSLNILHERNIANGDLQAENLIVNKKGEVLDLSIIDLDNFNAPGYPEPPMLGQYLYMAPEIRLSRANGKSAIPDIQTDLFSLGLLNHEIIMLKHLAEGSDSDETEFHKAMTSGKWLHDPASPDRVSTTGGYPADVLNTDLSRLFRKSVSLDRDERPPSSQWVKVLGEAINQVFMCRRCGGTIIVDSSKIVCPYCRRPYPALKLVTANGRDIVELQGAITIGRDNLKGSMKVSSRHAIFRRVGPETWMEPIGRNYTSRWAGNGWIPLQNYNPVLINSGDRLKFADVEVSVMWSGDNNFHG